MPFTPFRTSLLGVATEVGMLFHGEIVSMMILRPANALSTSRCTRSVSAFRNSCRALSSEVSPSSSLIELEVRRATEDLILSARCSALVGSFGLSCSVGLPVSVSAVDFADSDFSAGVFGLQLAICSMLTNRPHQRASLQVCVLHFAGNRAPADRCVDHRRHGFSQAGAALGWRGAAILRPTRQAG